MDEDVFYSVVLPLLLMAETALLCISTMSGDDDNFYSELLDMGGEEGEEQLIEQHRFYLACESCLKQGVGGTCKHKQDRVPAWQSSEKHNLVQKLYGHRAALHKQEAMGVRDSNDGQCFRKDHITRLYANPRYEFVDHYPIRKIYVTIDPNAGTEDSRDKSGSDFAMVSGFYLDYNETFVILGLESIDAKHPRDFKDRMLDHIDRLRSFESTKNALIVLIPESNLGMASGWLDGWVTENREYVVTMVEKELKAGVGTTHPVKKNMMHMTRMMLETDHLMFAKEMVCTGIESISDGIQYQLGELKRQLKVYQEFKQTPDNPLGKTRVGYTGKLGSGRKDDMCVALQLALFWSHKFRTHQKYQKWFYM
ncbi:MAG: hypothetical protein ACTSUE_22905 [Promethearchaeota archaeon]